MLVHIPAEIVPEIIKAHLSQGRSLENILSEWVEIVKWWYLTHDVPEILTPQ